MNVLRKTMLIFSMALLAAACDKDAIEEIGGEIPGAEKTKIVNLLVPAMAGNTRVNNTASANECAISDVYVFQFNASDGKLHNNAFQYFSGSEITNASGSTTNKTVAVELDDAASTIYVVANLGADHFTKDDCPKTLTDFQKETYEFASVISKSAVDAGSVKLPMVGKKEITAGASDIKIDMKRLVAKIGYTLNKAADAPSSLKLTSARLEYVLNSVLLEAKTADATRQYPATPAATDFFNNSTKYVYEEYTAADITGSEHIWYVPENLGGRNSAISGPKYKGGANVPDKYCTRIVVSGTVTYNGNPDTEVSFVIYPGANATTDFNIERNKVYSIESTVKNINITDLRVDVHDFEDLSAEGTSNSYMIHEAGKYKFLCNIKGNGATGLTATSHDNDDTAVKIDPSGCTVSLLWQSTNGTSSAGTVISDIALDGDYITFTTPSEGESFAEGNVLIALKKGSTTVWSWHIWATAYNPDDETANAVDVYTMRTGISLETATETVMRCNLGAINQGATGIAKETTANDCYGLFYQWGRKDPFLHATPADHTGSGSVDLAIANPTRFYTSSSDWTAKNNNLWGNGTHTNSSISIIHGSSSTSRSYNRNRGSKSIFDPCPQGWRVPPQYLWMNNVSATSQFHSGSPGYLTLTSSTSGGRNVNYPAAGCLHYSSAALTYAGTSGNYWSSSPESSSSTFAGSLGFCSGNVYPLHYDYRGYGFSVRCVRE